MRQTRGCVRGLQHQQAAPERAQQEQMRPDRSLLISRKKEAKERTDDSLSVCSFWVALRPRGRPSLQHLSTFEGCALKHQLQTVGVNSCVLPLPGLHTALQLCRCVTTDCGWVCSESLVEPSINKLLTFPQIQPADGDLFISLTHTKLSHIEASRCHYCCHLINK